MMPQWEFLDFIADEARKLATFTLRTRASVTGLIEEAGRVVGVRGTSPDGDFEVRAELSVGCDGRHSTVRAGAGLAVEDLGAPIDVLWFRVGRDPAELDNSLARIAPGHFVVTIDRGDYWQCAFVIAKGGAAALQQRPIAEFRAQVVDAAPILAAHIDAGVRSWDDVKLLTVAVDRLKQWSRPGLLCIGDAAHAMSPIGGVGINLAVQDAVAAANLLAAKLRAGTATPDDLDAVQRRRWWPTKATQAAQLAIQDNVLVPVMSGADAKLEVPLPMRIVTALPVLQRGLARLLGMGVRPEHVRTPAA
jgi:2-polyprenyl-6-methoxyphenol hydroxylase-like FAD-dependent oxidoreductase